MGLWKGKDDDLPEEPVPALVGASSGEILDDETVVPDFPPDASPPSNVDKPRPPSSPPKKVPEEEPEAVRLARLETEAHEADREHLRKDHGYFVSENAGHDAVMKLHKENHELEKKTVFFKPHAHQDGQVVPEPIPDSVPAAWSKEEMT